MKVAVRQRRGITNMPRLDKKRKIRSFWRPKRLKLVASSTDSRGISVRRELWVANLRRRISEGVK
jgi:hypothetical protein